MGRKCSQCNYWKSDEEYSNNQWYKGEGLSRCRKCVHRYICAECYDPFNHPNELKMHIQTYLPRCITCPLCEEWEFKSMANVLQHIESGCCSGTSGIENAREEIYDNADEMFGLQYADGYQPYDIPEYPYKCPIVIEPFEKEVSAFNIKNTSMIWILGPHPTSCMMHSECILQK